MGTEHIRYQARAVFVKGIYNYNYREAIEQKRKQYASEGWKLCVDTQFSEFKVTDSGEYRVILTRQIQGSKES